MPTLLAAINLFTVVGVEDASEGNAEDPLYFLASALERINRRLGALLHEPYAAQVRGRKVIAACNKMVREREAAGVQ